MKTLIFKNYPSFLRREDKRINGVSPEFAEKVPNWEQMNKTNIGCWNCYQCEGCKECAHCIHCKDCNDSYHCSSCTNCDDSTDFLICDNCIEGFLPYH